MSTRPHGTEALLVVLVLAGAVAGCGATCDDSQVPGRYSWADAHYSVEIELLRGGFGTLADKKGKRVPITWEWVTDGPQVLLHGELEMFQALVPLAPRLAGAKDFGQPGSGYFALGVKCENGKIDRLIANDDLDVFLQRK